MTRWARVGNSQKHKKVPEDATPWKDFWKNRNQNSTDDANRNKVKSGRIEKRKQKQTKKFGFDVKRKVFENPGNTKFSKFRNAEQEESENNDISPALSSKKETNEEHLTSEFQILSKKQLRKAKKKAKLQQLENTESNNVLDNGISILTDSTEISQLEENGNNHTSPKFPVKKKMNEENLTSEFQGLSKKQLRKAKLQQLENSESNNVLDNSISNVTEVSQLEENENYHTSPKFSSKNEMNAEHLTSEFQGLSKKQLRKAKKKAKLQHLENTESRNVQDNSPSKVAEGTEVSLTDDKSPKEKDFQGKKKLFMQKLEKKRKENGILLLPAKVERRLYIIKKRLREKGLPPAAIKDIARKERRKEELKFRRTMSTKPCFNCRQTGHLLAECPMPLGNSNQETGLCFKCGSADHTSYKCPKKIEGYPLAKCFVCKEQGHISKDCPKNERGVYIKGGKCSLCGNVNHLKKDCPTLKKKNDEEADITAYTINEEKSVDAEIIPTDDITAGARLSVKKGKKTKLVKF
ncbi:unnamed protein product [Larinioides sclopetarius]|uniref:CCHC-type domain-containing protein n=1 Tax=Larinioides sclopetarius TaxID=280406 RepID=A0AAV1Z207_9ARAC